MVNGENVMIWAVRIHCGATTCVIQSLWLPYLHFLSGGEGKRGKVIQIQDWDHNYPGSGVLVEWESGYRNLYRLAFRGKVRPVPYPLPVKLKQE